MIDQRYVSCMLFGTNNELHQSAQVLSLISKEDNKVSIISQDQKEKGEASPPFQYMESITTMSDQLKS